MNWSGHGEESVVPGFLPPAPSRSKPFVQEYILERNVDVQTSGKNSLTSAHCPGCGAPETLSSGGECEYCGLPQNDGASGWVLTRVRPFSGAPLEVGAVYASRIARELGISSDVPRANLPQLSDRENEALIICAIEVMRADGEVDDREMAQLKKMSEKRKITDERLQELLRLPVQGGEVCLPKGVDHRRNREFLRSMVLMCLSDGNVSRAEQGLIKGLGAKLGYSRSDIDQMIKQERASLYRESRRIRKEPT